MVSFLPQRPQQLRQLHGGHPRSGLVHWTIVRMENKHEVVRGARRDGKSAAGFLDSGSFRNSRRGGESMARVFHSPRFLPPPSSPRTESPLGIIRELGLKPLRERAFQPLSRHWPVGRIISASRTLMDNPDGRSFPLPSPPALNLGEISTASPASWPFLLDKRAHRGKVMECSACHAVNRGRLGRLGPVFPRV